VLEWRAGDPVKTPRKRLLSGSSLGSLKTRFVPSPSCFLPLAALRYEHAPHFQLIEGRVSVNICRGKQRREADKS